MKNVQPSKNASESLSATQKDNKVLISTVYPTKHPLETPKEYKPLREIKSATYISDYRKEKSRKNSIILTIVLLGMVLFAAAITSLIFVITGQ